MNFLLWWHVCLWGMLLGVSAVRSEPPNPTHETSTSSPVTTSTMSPEQMCLNSSATCKECVRITACYYCERTKMCAYYPYKHVFPNPEACDMGDVRWGVCWFNFKAMVISMGVIGAILIISLITCICCCCRKRRNTKLIQEEAKYERERELRRITHSEKQKEKQSKYDEIRKKYGLMKDDNPYQRFEA
uniref:PSI domain-containing protein n=1 Tax=Strigamia maritima TaxID=126957 RepID=T1JCW5_STRMM